MWIAATSESQLEPGVRFRYYWPRHTLGGDIFAYEGVFVDNNRDGLRKWKLLTLDGDYKCRLMGECSIDDYNSHYSKYYIWQEQTMEEFLNKLFAVIIREWVAGTFCTGGIQDLFNDVIANRMRGERDVEAFKADIVDWLRTQHGVEEYVTFLDELGIDYQKQMEIVVKIPAALNGFDADEFRGWLIDYCGDHTYVLDIQRGE